MGFFDLFKKKKAKDNKKENELPQSEKKAKTAPEVINNDNQITVKENEKSENNEKTEKKESESVKNATVKDKTEPKPAIIETDKSDEEKEEDKKETSAGAYTGRFEINKSKDGKKFFFNLYALNKVGIATSQMYSSAQSALNGVKSVIANAPTAPIEDQSLKNYETLPYPKWEIYIDNGGKYRFRLNASNGSCVCHSQGYTTKNACKNGIDSIIRSSKNAEIDKTYITKKEDN